MTEKDDRRFHNVMSFIGIRAPLAASATIQLVRELRRAGVLDDDAVNRIKDTMKHEAALSRRPHQSTEDFDAEIGGRLDELFSI